VQQSLHAKLSQMPHDRSMSHKLWRIALGDNYAKNEETVQQSPKRN